MRERIRVALSAALALSVLGVLWATPAIAEDMTDSDAWLTSHVYDGPPSIYDGPSTVVSSDGLTREGHAPLVNVDVDRHSGFNYDPSSNLVATNTLSARHRALALQNMTDSGDTVLGRYPGYINKANSRGASYFDIGDEWD